MLSKLASERCWRLPKSTFLKRAPPSPPSPPPWDELGESRNTATLAFKSKARAFLGSSGLRDSAAALGFRPEFEHLSPRSDNMPILIKGGLSYISLYIQILGSRALGSHGCEIPGPGCLGEVLEPISEFQFRGNSRGPLVKAKIALHGHKMAPK